MRAHLHLLFILLSLTAIPAGCAVFPRDPGKPTATDLVCKCNGDLGCVIVTLGRCSLLAMGLFTSIEQVNDLITSRIRSLEGVHEVETSISVHNIKYESGIARITKPGSNGRG